MPGSGSASHARATAGTLLKRFLTPIVATAVSAAAGYAAKKAPEVFEEKVLPKLRDLQEGSSRAARSVPAQAKSALGGAGDLAEDLTKRIRPTGDDAGGSNGRRSSLTAAELEQQRAERAQRRKERRKRSRS